MAYRLRPNERLKSGTDILRVLRSGEKRETKDFRIWWCRVKDTPEEPKKAANRLCVVVSKKVIRIAARRNRVKRLVREFFRLNKKSLTKNVDLVVQAKTDNALEYRVLESQLKRELERAELIK